MAAAAAVEGDNCPPTVSPLCVPVRPLAPPPPPQPYFKHNVGEKQVDNQAFSLFLATCQRLTDAVVSLPPQCLVQCHGHLVDVVQGGLVQEARQQGVDETLSGVCCCSWLFPST
jgi:hypothetical protein